MLAKLIKFFNKMQELLVGSNADGSLAMDQNTCMDVVNSSDCDELRELFDINFYIKPKDP